MRKEVKLAKHECVGHVQKRVTPKVKLARTSFKRDRTEAKKKEKALKDRMKGVREQYGLGRGRGSGSGEPQVEGSGIGMEKGRGKGRGTGRGKGRDTGRGKGRGTGRGKGKGKMVGEGEKKLRLLEVPECQLLDETIRVLQQYYGNAIRGNTGNLEKMTDACWVIVVQKARIAGANSSVHWLVGRMCQPTTSA